MVSNIGFPIVELMQCINSFDVNQSIFKDRFIVGLTIDVSVKDSIHYEQSTHFSITIGFLQPDFS